jgi:hypothetical protein
MLKITTKKEGDTLVVTLDGHLDTLTTPSLKETLDAELPGMHSFSRAVSLFWFCLRCRFLPQPFFRGA